MKAIAETEKKIDSLRASIRSKEAPLKVAQTRLNDRRARPGIESCHDPTQDQYVDPISLVKLSFAILFQFNR